MHPSRTLILASTLVVASCYPNLDPAPATPAKVAEVRVESQPVAEEPVEAEPEGDVVGEQAPDPRSCEQAMNDYVAEARVESKPELTAGAYGAVLSRGTYLAACGVAASTTVKICAAVRHGRVVGATVETEPDDPAAEDCVRNAVFALAFPASPVLDVTRTVFPGI